MRRAGIVLVAVLALGSASCLRLLFPDFECENECFPGETQCGDNARQICILEPFFGCLVWIDDVDCDDRNAVCVDATCVCDEGSVECPPDAICTFLGFDPWNCGACGAVCTGVCEGGVCLPPPPRPELTSPLDPPAGPAGERT
jgi:hypothetical protein